MTESKCAIWGTEANCSERSGALACTSARADGGYQITKTLLATEKWESLSVKKKAVLTSWIVDQHRSGVSDPVINSNNFDKITSNKELSVSKRIEKFLLYCQIENIRPGNFIFNYKDGTISGNSDQIYEVSIFAWTESRDWDDFFGLYNIMHASGYVDNRRLTPFGFEKLEELEFTNTNSKQVFVAMWFDPSLNDSYENAIEPAIREAGYDPRIIRKVEHNNKIDDEIVAEIRRSKFVVADFTCGFSNDGSQAIARGGVYYEAGFAQGLGLPVIWTCREDIIGHVHFDTRQYNHIVWKDAADLKERLLNRIRATIT